MRFTFSERLRVFSPTFLRRLWPLKILTHVGHLTSYSSPVAPETLSLVSCLPLAPTPASSMGSVFLVLSNAFNKTRVLALVHHSIFLLLPVCAGSRSFTWDFSSVNQFLLLPCLSLHSTEVVCVLSGKEA